MTVVAIAFVGISAVLLWVLLEQNRRFSKELIAQQIRHLEQYNVMQAEIRNLTGSIVRSAGGAFVVPESKVIPTEKWFEGKPYMVPKAGPHNV